METLVDPLVQGPRFSLSLHADMLERAASSDTRKCEHVAMEEVEETEDAEKEEEEEEEEEEDFDDGDTEFSFEFSNSVSLDLPQEHNMLSAEELFFNGKLRPLQAELSVFDQNGEELHKIDMEFLSSVEKKVAMERGSNVKDFFFKESSAMAEHTHSRKEREEASNLHVNLPMVKTSLHESLAMAKEHLRSLHESPRCLSMTIEGSRGHPRRSCVSLNNSRCSSPSRSRPSGGTFSQPPTTPTSPKAHSSQKNSKFLHFFKLKKHLTSNKDALLRNSESFSASSSRLSRTFWPFSRSNSAGESKSSHGVSPLPRRSNSAGESKTTSSALLPNNPLRHDGESKGENTTASLLLSARKLQIVQSNHDKKGLPPLPIANSKKTSSCLVPTNCGSDSVALSQPLADATPCIPAPTSGSSLSSTSTPSPSLSPASEEVSHVSRTQSLPNGEGDHSTHTHSHTHTHTHTQSSSSISTEFKASASPGRHVRHVSATNPVRSINRGSPARLWSNPNMTRGGLQRFGPAPTRGLMRPKDALSRETVSVRVTPVLNVPVCMTPSSKSKLFNLGNLFSKKEKVARGYTMLVSTDSQSGG